MLVQRRLLLQLCFAVDRAERVTRARPWRRPAKASWPASESAQQMPEPLRSSRRSGACSTLLISFSRSTSGRSRWSITSLMPTFFWLAQQHPPHQVGQVSFSYQLYKNSFKGSFAKLISCSRLFQINQKKSSFCNVFKTNMSNFYMMCSWVRPEPFFTHHKRINLGWTNCICVNLWFEP